MKDAPLEPTGLRSLSHGVSAAQALWGLVNSTCLSHAFKLGGDMGSKRGHVEERQSWGQSEDPQEAPQK